MDMHKDVAQLMTPLTSTVLKVAGKLRQELRSGFKDREVRPCVDFLLRQCTFPTCVKTHQKASELNASFVKWLCDELK